MHELLIKSKSQSYGVYFKKVNDLKDLLKDTVVIVDSNVYSLHESIFSDLDIIVVNCIEDNKTLDGSIYIINELIKRKTKVNQKISVVGGGIMQDLAGFVCSIYGRGLDYNLVPTTLLSQCDSCIGGKTSINHGNTKNILGTFYPPKSIYICVDFLDTLKESDLLSGFGEIIKFYILQKREDQFLVDKKDLSILIQESLRYKADIVEIDEFDKKERKFLNFGHTFGHALEIASNYAIPHGTAVLYGILIANQIAVHYNLMEENTNRKLTQIILPYTSHQEKRADWFDFAKLHELIKLDKKNTGCINMVLLTEEGTILQKIEDLKILEKAVNNVYEIIRLHN